MSSLFSGAIIGCKNKGFLPVIPDIKKCSPGEGDLLRGRDPVDEARRLAAAGTPALSVVTEEEHFGGSLKLLEKVAKATGLPVLRKDFIKTEEDLRISREYGAEAVLIICAGNTFLQVSRLYDAALSLDIEPLVETHTMEELLWVGRLKAQLVGINNRNIIEFEKDNGSVSTTEQLAKHAPAGAIVISESSISSREEAEAAINAGADAVLVGTALWKADDIVKCYLELSKKGLV